MEHNSGSSHSGLDYADIGCRVREARVEYGLTQEKLAEDVGVDAKHISRIENGHKKGSDQLIRRISEVTGNFVNTYAGVQLRNYMAEQMARMRRKYGADYEQPTAVPMISPAFNLPSKYIVHVVGPIVYPHLTGEHKDQLAQCYRASLDLAAENGCENIAFCCISTGVFMFPADKAAKIAAATVKEWLDTHPDSCMKKVIFNVFKDSDLKIYQQLLCASDRHGFRKIMNK
jgi:O-acetyl-ADP-ribose deacetylase (regulator of RNase III)/DNA-binding XRE family transcriptional regulator